MLSPQVQDQLRAELAVIRAEGRYKAERLLYSTQGPEIEAEALTYRGPFTGRVLNFCANNYLGLSSDPRIVEAAKQGLDERGYGMSSVRFICGTQDTHHVLEDDLSRFLGTQSAILYSSCFDANGGLFETLMGPDDMIISDRLNHASIIDGVRLSKAQRTVYNHQDMADLQEKLKEAKNARRILIATDGVFSMDGDFSPLDDICSLADRYTALVMVDDSHATGFVGPGGKGTPARYGIQERVDIVTGTFGKALGGASGGFTSGREKIVELLRQRSRPYLFSNSLAPPIVYGTLKALEIIQSPEGDSLRQRLAANTKQFREGMKSRGFDIVPGDHPIVPVMVRDPQKSQRMADDLLVDDGIYVVAFSYPVVSKGQDRVRVQLSAAHTDGQIERALEAFERAGKKYSLIG